MNTAAFIHGVRDLRVEPFNPPTASNDEVIVDVAAVGVCGSDLHYYKDGGIGGALIKQPFVPGHEFSARMQSDVEALNLTKGELVAVDPAQPCHSCQWCERGHHNLCPNVVFLGAPPFHGALTQSIAVPQQSLIKLPATMTADQGAMLEPLGVCIHAVDLAKPRLVESVAVLGCGAIGLGIIQLLKLCTTGKIYAIDPQAHRADAALKLGADEASLSKDSVIEGTAGLGCDLVIEATNSPNGFSDAVAVSKIGARIVLVGIPDGNMYSPLSAAEARRRGLTIRFSRRMGNVYPRAIELVAQRKVDVDALVSHHFSLKDTAQAFAMQDDEATGLLKSIITVAP